MTTFLSLPKPMKPRAGSYSWEQIEALLAQGGEWVMQEKLDGVRARTWQGKLWTNSGKLVPSKFVQRLFSGLPDGLDGELLKCDVNGVRPLHETMSLVMGQEDSINIQYKLFDLWNDPHNYWERHLKLNTLVNEGLGPCISMLYQHPIIAFTVLQQKAEKLENQGAEGFILRDLNAPYYYGRCGLRTPWLVRYKFWEDFEVRIVCCEEQMHNDNEQERDLFNHSKRSSCQENKNPAGVLGYFVGVDVKTGAPTRCGTGFSAAQRKLWWEQQESLIGKTIMCKRQKNGAKDRPRHPVFRCFRDPRDMELTP